MKRPRVMQLVVGGDIGGAERLVLDLASRPDETSAEHEIALFTPNPRLLELVHASGLLVHERRDVRENPLAYLRRSLGQADVTWLEKLLVDRRIDVLHTHTFGSHVLGTRAARRARCAQLRTEHHVMHYKDPSFALFTRWAAARTDRFVAVSEYVRDVLVRTAPEVAKRTVTIRNGVDPDRFAPREPPGEGAPFSASIVCRLTAWKRVDLAIRASAVTGVPLVVVGDGEERPRLEAWTKKLGAPVTLVGFAPDPRPFVAASDVTLSASKREPLGLSVLESLSMERPVVAVAGGGILEIVQHDTTGWLVPDTGLLPLADALRRAKGERSRLRTMGAAARRFVQGHATLVRMCEQYAGQYEALGRRR
jgi:L-malate glycosyltransferase